MKDYYYGIIGGVFILSAIWVNHQNGNETLEFGLMMSGIVLMTIEAYKKWKKA